MYKIGELSKLCKIPVKTLRYYDHEGLLIPDNIDKFTGYRYYSASKLSECNKIIALKELGFTLEEIKKQMYSDDTTDILSLIIQKEQQLNSLKLRTESQLKRLSIIKNNMERENQTMFNVTIRNSDTIRIACLRDIYHDKEQAFRKIQQIEKDLPTSMLGKRRIIINYETEYCDKDYDLAAGIELLGNLPKDSCYMDKVITFTSDVATLVCNKDELQGAYDAITKHLQEVPCQIIGAFYEIYYEDDTVELKVPVCRLSIQNDKHQNDDIKIPFENDEEVIGKWEFIDQVPDEEQFNISKIKSHSSVWLEELYFLPKGEWFWCIAGWTKGYVFTTSGHPKQEYKNKYTIKSINGQKYLFLEMKDYDHESRGGMPTIWVYKKVSDKEYSRNEICIRDNIDYPFIMDEKVIGKWKVQDFALEKDEFNPGVQSYPRESLFFISAEFKPDGTITQVFEPPINRTYTIHWTNGTLLDKNHHLAPAYEIRVLNGCEFLFIEWKSGDYQFGGRKPCYYVFVRE